MIKNLVTDEYIRAERKYRDAQTVRNLVRVFASTNHEHIWNVNTGERRLSMFELSESHMQDLEYFKEIRNELAMGGFGRLLYELMEFEVNKQLVHRPLQNKARRKQALYTKTPTRILAEQMLKQKEVFFKVLDANRDIVAYYRCEEEKWRTEGAFIPSKIARMALDELISRKGFQEEKYSAKDPRASVIGLVKLLGGKGDYTTRAASVRGVTEKMACYFVPNFSESLKAFCEDVGLDVDDIFDDSIHANVVEFPTQNNQKLLDTPF